MENPVSIQYSDTNIKYNDTGLSSPSSRTSSTREIIHLRVPTKLEWYEYLKSNVPSNYSRKDIATLYQTLKNISLFMYMDDTFTTSEKYVIVEGGIRTFSEGHWRRFSETDLCKYSELFKSFLTSIDKLNTLIKLWLTFPKTFNTFIMYCQCVYSNNGFIHEQSILPQCGISTHLDIDYETYGDIYHTITLTISPENESNSKKVFYYTPFAIKLREMIESSSDKKYTLHVGRTSSESFTYNFEDIFISVLRALYQKVWNITKKNSI